MDTTMWRIMIDDEIGFLIKTATSEQAKQIVTQRFKVNPNEIISVKPDTPNTDDEETNWKKEELASTFDKPKFKPDKPKEDMPFKPEG